MIGEGLRFGRGIVWWAKRVHAEEQLRSGIDAGRTDAVLERSDLTSQELLRGTDRRVRSMNVSDIRDTRAGKNTLELQPSVHGAPVALMAPHGEAVINPQLAATRTLQAASPGSGRTIMEQQATPNSQGSRITNGNKPTGNQTSGQTHLAPTSTDSQARAVMRWTSPFGLMRVFMDELDRLVEGFGLVGRPAEQSSALRQSQDWIPAVEVLERDGELVIRADLPGLDADELDVAIADDRVVLSGERVDEQVERASSYYRRERSYGRFYRVVPLPEGVDTSHAEATFDNGVLEISIPAPRRPEARKLEVKDGASNESSAKAETTPLASSNPASAH